MVWVLAMSKERQLLKEIMSYIAKGGLAIIDSNSDVAQTLFEVQELLAQPEREPVAWMCNLMGDVVTYRPNVNNGYTPLYTSPPKREPLSEEQVCKILIKKEWKGFLELVRQIEKAHGIGGKE